MKAFLLFIFTALSHIAIAQNYDKAWVFGNQSGIDFNTVPPTAVTSAMFCYEGSASIADDNGQLLFYTNGVDVWDRNNQLMPNGAGIMTLLPNYAMPTTTQQAAIVRIPGASKYYIFSLRDYEPTLLCYSVVDMSLNGGLGDVVAGQKAMLMDSMLTEKMSVVAGNNCDIWLMVRSRDVNRYKAYHITAAGIDPVPVISNTGSGTQAIYSLGYLVFSPDRSRMAVAVGNSIELYQFNATTGIVSGMQILASQNVPYPDSYYGVCFSPDNTKIYTGSMNGGTDQFDITQPTTAAILASRVELDNELSAGLRLAPDGKIYLPRVSSSMMRSIEFPNLAGTACQFNPNALQLDTINFYSLPNYNVSFHRDSINNRYIHHLCRDTIPLSPFNSGIGYQWENGSANPLRKVTQPGTYVLKYHYICSYFADTFIVLPRPVFPQLTYLKGNCEGQLNGSLVFGQQNGDTTTYHYTLLDGASNVSGEAWSSSGFQALSLPAGLYTLHIATAGGCDTTLSLTITSLPAPDAAFSSSPPFCAGEPVVFLNTSSGPYTGISWYFGDATSSLSEAPLHVYAAAGDYSVMLVATDSLCHDTATATIHINAFQLDLITDKVLPLFGEMITLQTQAAEPYTVSAWLPVPVFAQQQALSQLLRADTSRTYLAVGRSVANGCSDTASVIVPVQPMVHMPSAFSPNGDGLNDYFRPVIWGSDISIERFQVYDRWGKRVWSENGASALRGWDGHYGNGGTATVGTYYWYFEYRDAAGHKEHLKGDVALLR